MKGEEGWSDKYDSFPPISLPLKTEKGYREEVKKELEGRKFDSNHFLLSSGRTMMGRGGRGKGKAT